MLEAFSAMRQVHELLVLLEEASKLPLLASERQRLGELLAVLDPVQGLSSAALAELERSSLCDDVTVFLRSLAGTARRALKLVR